ncbi:putative amino acid transporter [Teratosphaeria destructans]|uniref:Amino acid transporter n=1 Tax=Teratosphaeria destructans TaxID=418781 RepID=A0A9W7SIQ4_9PEZI|nr:putative amino acid transporter [Teratosphaeria destructans]
MAPDTPAGVQQVSLPTNPDPAMVAPFQDDLAAEATDTLPSSPVSSPSHASVDQGNIVTRDRQHSLSDTVSRTATLDGIRPGTNTPATQAQPNRSRKGSVLSSLKSTLKSRRSSGNRCSEEQPEKFKKRNVDVEARSAITGLDQDGDVLEVQDGSRVHYKTMHWWHAGIVMIAETISLGIMSLPSSLATMGFVPGIILIVFLGMCSWYNGYSVYMMKRKHDAKFTSFADGLALMCGIPGRVIGEISQTLLQIFIVAAHIVTFAIELNTLTDHGTCTVVFTVVGAVVCFIATLPRTYEANSWISILSTIIAMIGIGIDANGYGNTFAVLPSRLADFPKAARAISAMILAYSGHIAYPSILDEMKAPRDFPKSLAMVGIGTTSFYVLVAAVIYAYAGQEVAAPALGSASAIVSKVAYGVATPTIVVAGVIAALVCAKATYKHVWRKNPGVMEERSWRGFGSWVGILAVLYIVAWIIASVIPDFGNLLALIGALFGTWYCLGFPAMFWLWTRWQEKVAGPLCFLCQLRNAALVALNLVLVLMSLAISVLGIYGSAIALGNSTQTRAPFSCASNANPMEELVSGGFATSNSTVHG